MLINSPYQTKYINTLKHKAQSNKVLASYTKKVDKIDPFTFYQISKPANDGKRFFWKSPDDDTTIVGVGLLRSFSNSGAEDRFRRIETEWKEILSSAVIDNPFHLPGTGPLLFGGFSFDPYSLKEEKWQPFGDALFYLPEYMLTVIGEEYYLTVNLFESEELVNQSNKVKNFDLIIKNAGLSEASASYLISKEELFVPQWLDSVAEVVNILKSSDLVNKVVLSRQMQLNFSEPVLSEYVLKQLHTQQKDSFIFLLETPEGSFAGASPERLVKKIDDQVLSTSLAGSIGRSENAVEDRELGNILLNDEKNLYEHSLVVDMIKKALKPHCNELQVPDQPILLRTPYIQHLYTPVSGVAKPETSIFNLVGELHPTPALGGVPTGQAMKIIRDEEKMDRGFYASPIGWTDFDGNGEFIVAIRSGLLKGKQAFLYAGCGLVADSDPKEELKETGIKFQPMLQAIGGKSE
ncbi:isochorismate synthase [Siminovitchia terrae]|uniref:isochorismate synthase n=1 Tax=Siminovitchia terrae TaxID=1914933 RepID=A0A429X0Y2_SIMTE|nr:isochorismate synthase [Siminovitchia terrae]RST57154.1 isochorismate synthase [Siminovitchia terrae]